MINAQAPSPPPCAPQAKSVGDSGLVDKLEADARLMSYQAHVAERLEVRADEWHLFLCGRLWAHSSA